MSLQVQIWTSGLGDVIEPDKKLFWAEINRRKHFFDLILHFLPIFCKKKKKKKTNGSYDFLL